MKNSVKAITIVTTVTLSTLSIPIAFANELTEYQGSIGQSAIHLTLEYNDSFKATDVSGLYAYDKYDTPIFLIGRIENGNLILSERDENWKPSATITIPDFDKKLTNQTGTWKSLNNDKSYPIKLQWKFDYNTIHKNSTKPVLVADSNKHHYFKLLLGKSMDVKALQVYEKGSDTLIQEMPYNWNFNLWTISTDDYNFDDHEDFSYQSETYAGSNTRSVYYLWNPKNKKYEESNIRGISLKFDQSKKRIYEVNRTAAGRYENITTYKLNKDNQMIKLGTKCTEYNFDSNDDSYIEIACEDDVGK